MSVTVEVCVESVSDAMSAESCGASRVELCANLNEGGTTPSAGMIRAALAHIALPVFVMIRPRGGDFLYSAAEIDVMLRDIEMAKTFGAHGIVSGALHANGVIDEEGLEALLDAANPLPFTFHRAFDHTRDLHESLDTLMAMGVARVLTSGGSATAVEGAEALHRLVVRAGARIAVMAGGGVRAGHVAQLVRDTGCHEVHLGPRSVVTATGKSAPRAAARINKAPPPDDTAWSKLDTEAVRATITALSPAAR